MVTLVICFLLLAGSCLGQEWSLWGEDAVVQSMNAEERLAEDWSLWDVDDCVSEPAKVEAYSSQELDAWVRSRYTPSSPLLYADVNPRSGVWDHLVNDHGFAVEQVKSLPQWVALQLHSDSHGGKIAPKRTADLKPVPIKVRSVGVQSGYSWTGSVRCSNGNCRRGFFRFRLGR
jgi:hypothetical protein